MCDLHIGVLHNTLHLDNPSSNSPLTTPASVTGRCNSVCMCDEEKEEEEEKTHRDTQMLKDKAMQLRSINCQAGKSCARANSCTLIQTPWPPSG